MVYAPAAAALCFALWSLAKPSPWTDEVVTMEVARRSGPQLVQLLGHVDAVHGLYYGLVHALGQVIGVSTWTMRLPSAIAVSLAAGGVGWLGRRLAGARAGWYAGLLLAVLPTTSRYGQEARSYALVMALAVLATCALLKVLEGSSRWHVTYAALVSLLGLLNVMGLLLVAAHMAAVVWQRPGRRTVTRLLVAQTAGVIAVIPLLALGYAQRSAVDQAAPVGVRTLPAFFGWLLVPGQQFAPHALKFVFVATAITAAAVTLAHLRKIPSRLVPLTMPWLTLPPLALLAASLSESHFAYRYLLFCLPAAALLLGAACARAPVTQQLALGLLLGTLLTPVHLNIRQQDSRPWDTTAIVNAVQHEARAYDGVLFTGGGCPLIAAAYPQVFAPLNDLATVKTAAQMGTLANQPAPRTLLAQRLSHTPRVWHITCRHLSTGTRPAATQTAAAHESQLTLTGQLSPSYRRTVRGMDLTLYEE
ncbi:glycosyltransferase family 39 protein [Streptomyces sp. NBC_01142]|uniref:glycosyltransferase family 39 protein n=1 Tax=Streptomyces sp. NBC_01142 TaxID=2975865 RepID=UPI00224EC2DC|nr:glycosyltransferase family 39 protein [Streptomyces sp. NBC_01142]MCX4825810.1 glycosyltransferase family 39 protein [Streptomyces sp. NBC_01142]